jgi:RNA polymerase sigma-70 factor (ECF subfamily)
MSAIRVPPAAPAHQRIKPNGQVLMFPRRVTSLRDLDDEVLVAILRADADSDDVREELFGRYTRRVASWCLGIARTPEEAQDVAQEVFLLVHQRLHTFRAESKFSTWLYTIARRVALNRARASTTRRTEALDRMPEPVSERLEHAPEELAQRAQVHERLREALRRDLTAQEAEILILHFVHGVTLKELTARYQLDNKSGAKAVVVSARRKLERRFGRWLATQTGGRPWS